MEYLAGFDVPLNVLFFRYFVDEDREYLARTWLVDEARTGTDVSKKSSNRREPWNGHDWYVSFGEDDSGIRSWDDARKYSFVSVGGRSVVLVHPPSLPLGARGSSASTGLFTATSGSEP